MTQKQCWALFSALVLALTARAQCPKQQTCPSHSGSVLFGIGVNSDAGLNGSVIVNETNCDIKKCPECPSCPDCCKKCPECAACPGCCQKCPERKGSLSIGLGVTLLPGPLPLPVPTLDVNLTSPTPGTAPAEPQEDAADEDEPEIRQFTVEAKLVETKPGEPEHVITCPRMTVLEGQPASFSVCTGMAQAGCASDPHGSGKPEDGFGMELCIRETKKGNLLLGFGLEQVKVEKSGPSRTVVKSQSLEGGQVVKPGERTKLVLEKNDQGGARSWVEVVVKEAGCEPARGVQGAGCLMDHPFAGEFACPPERVPPPAVAAPPAGPGMVILPAPMPAPPPFLYPPDAPGVSYLPVPPPVMPCVATQPANMAAGNPSIFRAVKQDNHARLEVLSGPNARLTCKSMTWGVAGSSPLKFTVAGERVHVSGAKLQAYANRVIADGPDRLVLEGRVRMCCGEDGCCRRIKADKITFHLSDGHLDVEMQTRSRD